MKSFHFCVWNVFFKIYFLEGRGNGASECLFSKADFKSRECSYTQFEIFLTYRRVHGAMGIIPDILFLCLECIFQNIYFWEEEQIEFLSVFPH